MKRRHRVVGSFLLHIAGAVAGVAGAAAAASGAASGRGGSRPWLPSRRSCQSPEGLVLIAVVSPGPRRTVDNRTGTAREGWNCNQKWRRDKPTRIVSRCRRRLANGPPSSSSSVMVPQISAQLKQQNWTASEAAAGGAVAGCRLRRWADRWSGGRCSRLFPVVPRAAGDVIGRCASLAP